MSIEQGDFIIKTSYGYNELFDGFYIKTSEQVIKVGISSNQSCCENFGCLVSEDNPSDFVGALLRSVAIVDMALNQRILDETNSLDEGGALFVNFNTSKGLFQIVAYNAHNGYYGHHAVLVSKQESVETVL